MKQYGPQRVLDGDNQTYWATPDGVLEASLEIPLPDNTTFNRFLIQEYIPLGQRVADFSLSVQQDGQWIPVATATTIGYKRILRFETQTGNRIKVDIRARAPIAISNIGLYHAPGD